jgi:hypothetical protein
MYILHSFDKDHLRLYREAKAMCPELDQVQSMWAIVNLDYCKSNMGRLEGDGLPYNGLTYDDSFQNAMYAQVGIAHYLWNYENALCLLEEERKYSYIVLVNKDGFFMIGRYGAFEPEYEEEQVYYLSPHDPWLTLRQVASLDETLGSIIAVLDC